MSISTPVRCKCRKQAETGLKCSRCDTPICPDCSRPAPIGFFCRACASNRKSPLYQVSAGSFALAALAGVGVSTLGAWILVPMPFGNFFTMVAGFFLGNVIGEVLLRVTARKRGIKMEVLAGVVAAAGMLVCGLMQAGFHSEAEVGMVVARQPSTAMLLVLAGVTMYGAVNKIRFL